MTINQTLFVIDACVVLKWVLPEEYSENALLFLERYGQDPSMQWIAPDLVYTEVANGLYKKTKTDELTVSDAKQLYAAIREQSMMDIFDAADFMDAAYDVAEKINHNAIYDCIYLALAILESARLLTADKVLFERAIKAGYNDSIIFISDI